MDDYLKSKIIFDKYLIEKTNFKINKNFISKNEEIRLDLDIKNEIQLEPNTKFAVVKIKCNIFKNSKSNNYPFTISVDIVGMFHYEDNMERRELISLLENNGTAILFPYLRSHISFLTSNSGIPMLMLPTINVANLIKHKQKVPN